MRKKRGFSLVELLVVMGIIALLTTVLLPNLVGMRTRAKDVQKKQDLESIKGALRIYYNDFQLYPSASSQAELEALLVPTYMPVGVATTYDYSQVAGGDGFVLRTELESDSGGEGTNSQLRCRLTPTPGVFAVCAY